MELTLLMFYFLVCNKIFIANAVVKASRLTHSTPDDDGK